MTPFTYGEITFEPIAEILSSLSLEGKSGLTFYDLGSGFGKPCLAAALVLSKELSRCVGIEYLDGLYDKSLELKEAYEREVVMGREGYPTIEFKKDDFLKNTQWANEVDVLFMNATCFEPHMVTSISKTLAEQLKSGAVVIMTTKTLAPDVEHAFTKNGTVTKEMSWGKATVNVYFKH